MNMSTPKEQYIENLFDSIASKYDLLNSILSLGLHKRWRRFAARLCGLSDGDRALDVCAGTMDLAIEIAKIVGATGSVTAVDFSRSMLSIGERKLKEREIGNIVSVEARAESLPFCSESFRAATIGFGLRNVSSVNDTLAEMTRVVERGGRVLVLEFARPKGFLFKYPYLLYLRTLVPLIGWLVHGQRDPYSYLPESICRFHSRQELAMMMKKVGLDDVRIYDLAAGAVAIYVGTKR